MDPYKVLKVGDKYSKSDLSTLLKQPTISNVREGKFKCKNSDSYLLFVDLEKEQILKKKRHYKGLDLLENPPIRNLNNSVTVE